MRAYDTTVACLCPALPAQAIFVAKANFVGTKWCELSNSLIQLGLQVSVFLTRYGLVSKVEADPVTHTGSGDPISPSGHSDRDRLANFRY